MHKNSKNLGVFYNSRTKNREICARWYAHAQNLLLFKRINEYCT